MLPHKLGQGQLSWQIIRGAAVTPAAATSVQQNGSPDGDASAVPDSTAGVSRLCWLRKGPIACYLYVWNIWKHGASKHRGSGSMHRQRHDED